MFKARERKNRNDAAAERRESKPSWSKKWARFKGRLNDPEWIRYGKLLIAGKFLGLAALVTILYGGHVMYETVFGAPAMAQTAAPDPYAAIKASLQARLAKLTNCKGKSCDVPG